MSLLANIAHEVALDRENNAVTAIRAYEKQNLRDGRGVRWITEEYSDLLEELFDAIKQRVQASRRLFG